MRLKHSAFLALTLITLLSCAANHRPRHVAETRTAYWGYVEIEPVSLSELKRHLDSIGCHEIGAAGESTFPCRYKEAKVLHSDDMGIEINPSGFKAMGPVSFWVTERRLWAGKDLPGSPDPEKFKDAVRDDVRGIGSIVRIEEDSWMILETWDVTDAVY